MNLSDIANARLMNQQIGVEKFKTAKELVHWMGAMQAQDFAMVKWAVGIRLSNSTNQMVETAFNNGEIIRTHLLRPTWHLVTANNIRWLLDLTAPRLKAQARPRHKELELSESIFKKSNSILEKALRDGNHLTREELIAQFGKAKIATDDNRASHIFSQAELNGLICSGAIKEGKQTFALLEERIPKSNPLTREEALAKLAGLYFTSHGPASLQDFIWWSGLSVSEAKQALEMAKSGLNSEAFNSQTYWFANSFNFPASIKESVYLLPAFDEFIISYKDRTASLPFESHSKAVSNNGIFWPVIAFNGQIIGTWKRTVKKEDLFIETNYFKKPSKTVMKFVEKASGQFGSFLEKNYKIKSD